MTTTLRLNDAPIVHLRQQAEAYAHALATALVHQLHSGFSVSSPAPVGSAPARKTGALANSIVAQRIGRYQWQVLVGAGYALYLERGTRRMGARPFFVRAVGRVQSTPPKVL